MPVNFTRRHKTEANTNFPNRFPQSFSLNWFINFAGKKKKKIALWALTFVLVPSALSVAFDACMYVCMCLQCCNYLSGPEQRTRIFKFVDMLVLSAVRITTDQKSRGLSWARLLGGGPLGRLWALQALRPCDPHCIR